MTIGSRVIAHRLPVVCDHEICQESGDMSDAYEGKTKTLVYPSKVYT